MIGVTILLIGLWAGELSPAWASDYPRKAITVVVTWPAGSGTGIVAQKIVNIIIHRWEESQVTWDIRSFRR